MQLRVCVWAAAVFGLVSIGAAQTAIRSGEEVSTSSAADYEQLKAALQRRQQLADDVSVGRKAPGDALTELRTVALPEAFRGDADADFARSATDVGIRLHAAGKKEDAAQFFGAADQAFTEVINRTRDSEKAAKGHLLASRAFIRAQFLGQVSDAITDLDTALRLSPDDPYLQDMRRTVLADKGEWLAGKSQD